jgi:hypothetical protein
MTHAIKFTSEGPAGMVYYSEQDFTLPFYWERGTVGFDVYLRTSEEWLAFCDEHNAEGAKGRRDEIVARLAHEIRRQEARGAKVSIDNRGITFSYEGDWLHRILGKILGVD